MSNATSPLPGYQLLRKQHLLKKIPFSKSSLHAKLDPRSRYFDDSFPRPIYFPGSRIPFWDETMVDAWIAASSRPALKHAPAAEQTKEAPELQSHGPATTCAPMRPVDGSPHFLDTPIGRLKVRKKIRFYLPVTGKVPANGRPDSAQPDQSLIGHIGDRAGDSEAIALPAKSANGKTTLP